MISTGYNITGLCCHPAGFLRLVPLITFLTFLAATPQVTAQATYTGADGVTVDISDRSRIVSIGSAVTETIFALGAEENLVAVDESSLYPEETAAIPKVSFTRNLSAEGVLSMEPTLILASGAAGPETALRQIRSTGAPLLIVSADETVDAAFERVEQLGAVLGREERAMEVSRRLAMDLERAATLHDMLESRPVVLFIYARGPNHLMVAGNRTSAKTMIELAGGVNAFDEFEGYKPLTPEAVVAVNPSVILMMNSGLQSVGGTEWVRQAPGVSLTDAAKNNRIHSMDGSYLLGFGPRMGQAVLDLMEFLHPGTEIRQAE
ncbi:MAG: helical backbone metal receptor [Balneolaceae bacterium]